MKKIIQLLFILLVFSFQIFAQAPEAFKYQAVVRDVSGNVIANQSVAFQLSILQGSSTGSAIYVETQLLSTNAYGLANMEIGNGTLVSGNFSAINWSNDIYFVQVEMDPSGGSSYTLMGTSPLLSVPYALNAKTADNVFDGDYNSLSNTPTNISSFTNDVGYITDPTDLDSDTLNEIQTIILVSDTIILSNGGGSVSLLPYMDNTDSQNLSLVNNNLSITNGNTVDLSGLITSDSNWTANGVNIYNNNLGNVGIGTSTGSSYRLSVKASGSNGIQVNDGANSTINLNVNPGSNPYMYFSDGTSSTMLSQLTNGHFVMDSYSGSPYQFEMEQNGTGTGIYINSSSQVGIGTTTPNAALHVSGHIWQTGTGQSVFLGEDAGTVDDLSANNNVFVGYHSGNQNTIGEKNTALGHSSLLTNQSGNWNTAIGSEALLNNTVGTNNTAIGYQSSENMIDGDANVSVGAYALNIATSGNNNTAIGPFSLLNNNGDRNTAVGYLSFPDTGPFDNSTAIGYFAQITASNMIRLGDNNITTIGGAVGWSVISDGRFKKNISEDVPGLDFIKKLRPVSYNINMNAIARFMDISEENRDYKAENYKESYKQTGFVAQEVEEASNELGYSFSGVHHPETPKDYYSLRYSEFVVPLVKAVQEQQIIIEQQQEMLEKMQKEILLLKTKK